MAIIDNLPFLEEYAKAAAAQLSMLIGRSLTDAEVRRLHQVTQERTEDTSVAIVNQHKQIRVDTTLGRLAGWLTSRKPMAPVVTGHGTVFKPHAEYHSTVCDMVTFLMDTRKVAKNQMFELMREGRSPDDPEVKALDQRQKIFKLLANS